MRLTDRYEVLELLGEGGMGTVYRAQDRLTGGVVALKRVLLRHIDPDDPMATDLRLSLAREFQLLATLRHPHIISVLDYGFDYEAQPFFTMEFLEQPRTLVEAARGLDQGQILRMLLQVLSALEYLHRHQLSHRDLKPNNILVRPDGQVKLLDFGLATSLSREDEAYAGTLAYMAPELLDQTSPSPASDLYSFGVVAYEALTGRHPYPADSLQALINLLLASDPDLSPFMQAADAPPPGSPSEVFDPEKTELLPAREAPSALFSPPIEVRPLRLNPIGAVIRRLLAKQAGDRYKGPREAALAFYAALEQLPPPESQDIRESFLYSAPFLGREAELTELSLTLFSAVAGEGALVLLGAEHGGMGRSRLMDELNVVAQTSEILVLTGACRPSHRQPYQAWRSVMRRLCLSASLSEAELAILHDLIPDLPQLLGRPLVALPPLEARAHQQRLIRTMAALMSRHPSPLLILLEDVHWGREELLVLEALAPRLATLSVMILASYRADKRPDLPAKFPSAKSLMLGPLRDAHISSITQAMLGPVAQQAKVQAFVKREMGSNLFSLIEVLRMVAEQAESDPGLGLTEQSLGDQLGQILQQRLQHIRLDDQPMLRLAAVAGPEIDLALLRHIDDEMDYDLWAARCHNAAIFSHSGSGWRFAHQDLREALLRDLADEEVPRLYSLVARALEELHPSDSAQADSLMHYWQQAQQWPRAGQYAVIAGDTALAVGALPSAREYYVAASGWALPTDLALHLHLARQLAKVDQALGDYGEASLYLKRGLAYAFQLGDDDQQVLLLYDLSVLSLIQGHYGTAQAYLNAALPLAQGERQADLLALVLYGQGQVAYLRNNLDDAESYLTEALALARARHTEGRVMDTLLMLGQISEARTKFGLAQNYYLQVLHLAGQAKTRPMEAAALEHLGQLFGRRSDFLTARSYLNKAVNLNRELLYSPGLSSALLAYGEMELALGNPGPAKAAIVEGLTLAQEMGLVALQLGGILAMLALLAQQGPVEALLPMLGMVQRHPACHADLYRKSVDLLATWPVDSHSKSRGITQGRTLTLEGVMEHLLVGKRA